MRLLHDAAAATLLSVGADLGLRCGPVPRPVSQGNAAPGRSA